MPCWLRDNSGMANVPDTTNALTALREISLSEVEQRLVDLDSERAALSLLRRSLAARDRVKRRSVLVEDCRD